MKLNLKYKPFDVRQLVTEASVGGAGGTTGLIINNTATDGDPFLAF